MIHSKKSGLLLILVVFFTGAVQGQQRIEGTFIHAPVQSHLYLYESSNAGWIAIDTLEVKEGKFEFTFDSDLPRSWYKLGLDQRNSFDVILGNEDIKITGDFNQLSNSVDIKASDENGLLKDYLTYYQQDQAARKAIVKKVNNSEAVRNRVKRLQAIQGMMDSLDILKNKYHQKLAKDHPTLFIGKLADFYAFDSTTNADSYFTAEDFQDRELFMASFYQNKVLTYFQRFVPKNLANWDQRANFILGLTAAQTEGREFAYLSLIYLFRSVAPEKAREIAVRYQREYPQSPQASQLLAAIPKGGPSIGEEAPDIVLQDTTGAQKPLSSLKGQYVLLDFWASWCGPCRRENPNVVKVYNEFKSKGFTIYSVSLDNNRDKWLAAIDKDQLAWHHVSDLKGWGSDGAALYKVRSIPATYLIDPEGKIIAKNLRGAQLEQTLRKTLTGSD